ncbi:Hypothetical predicted protein [Podarcis lilfordi]|uniref:Uncharacterized protein n=1 Tax=Podarcis lilfordi TaxID=74358 RepID=A0AA35PJN7_9SAUR|nr:Hypothetical predicted protein [Podarcis lilfordi]
MEYKGIILKPSGNIWFLSSSCSILSLIYGLVLSMQEIPVLQLSDQSDNW